MPLIVLQQTVSTRCMVLAKFVQNTVNIKVQGVTQSQSAADPWHQEEEKKDSNWLTCAKQSNKCARSTKTSCLFPKRGDHNAKQDWKNTRTKSKARLNIKRPVVKTTKPHKLMTMPDHRLRMVSSNSYGRLKVLSTNLHPRSRCNT